MAHKFPQNNSWKGTEEMMAGLSPRSPALNWKPICICPSAIVSNSQAEHNLAAKFALTRQLSAAVRHQAQVRLPVGTPTAACQPL